MALCIVKYKNACLYAWMCATLLAVAGSRKKQLTASEMGRLGGKARARRLSKEQMSESNRKAAQARWAKKKAQK